MKRLFLNLISFVMLAVSFSTAYSVQAQTRPYRVSDRQVRTLLNQIANRTDTFRNQFNRSLDRSTMNGTRSEDAINSYVNDFQKATDNLRDKFNSRRDVAADVQEVLNRASFIEGFMRDYRLNSNAQSQWSLLRSDLNTLATYYNVSWNPNYSNPNTTNPYSVSTPTLRTLLNRIETRTDAYKSQMNTALDRSVLNRTRTEDNINAYITDFENATDALKQRFNDNRSVCGDVQEVLNRAAFIDTIMQNNRFSARAEQQWEILRTDLNTLAGYYSVGWNWSAPSNNWEIIREVNSVQI